jgi:hypothetical protein
MLHGLLKFLQRVKVMNFLQADLLDGSEHFVMIRFLATGVIQAYT